MTIVHKKSSVSGKRPKNSDLVPGELAINTADGSIFLERDDGEIIPVNGHCSVTASDAAPTDTTSYAHLASFECGSEYVDYNGIFVLTLNASTKRCSTIFSIYLRVNGKVNGILVDPTINIDIHSSTPNEFPTGPDNIYITYNTPATTTDKCKFELWVKKTHNYGKISLSKLSSSSNRPKTVFTETFNNTPLNDESVTSPKRLDGVPWLSSLSSPLPKLVQSKMKNLSDTISPLYWNNSTFDANDIEPGQRVLCRSDVLNVPPSGNNWYIESKKTYSSGSALQIAYEYSFADPSEVNTKIAVRHQRDGGAWSNWKIFDSQKNEERERVKVADRATHELLPCVYNPVNKTLVQAAPYDYSYSTTTLGINVVDATTTPDTTTKLYRATLQIPAALVGELRDTIFQGTFIQKFTTAANNNIIVLPSTWVTTDKPINNPNEAYYTVTLNSESPLSNYTNIVGINYSNKTLILGEVTNVSSTAKTFTLDNNTSLSLIGIGAYVKTQDGTANIGVVTSNKGGKITVEEVSGGFAAYEAGANGAAKRTRLRISNPLTTYPDIQGSTLGTYTTPINTRILVKNQGYVTAQNGIYTLSSIGSITSKVPYVLTRASDFDRGSLIYGASVKVVNGVSGDTLFKNNLKSSFWTHYSTGVEYEENGVFARGTLQDLSGSIVLSNCFSVNNVTFKITGLGLDNNTNKYYVSYVVKETTTVYNRKSIDKNLTTESSLANPITLPSEIFYKVYDVTTNTVLSSLPVGATIDYVVYGYGV